LNPFLAHSLANSYPMPVEAPVTIARGLAAASAMVFHPFPKRSKSQRLQLAVPR
jgi:hypothetical protein